MPLAGPRLGPGVTALGSSAPVRPGRFTLPARSPTVLFGRSRRHEPDSGCARAFLA